MDRSTNSVDASQVAFLLLQNGITTEKLGSVLKRGGSAVYSQSGDIYGLGGYAKTTTFSAPLEHYPLRVRVNGGNYYIDQYDAGGDTWAARTLGANIDLHNAGMATFAQIDDVLAIFAGRPCMALSDTSDINRLGGPAPTAAPTVGVGAAGSLTGTCRYFYTFYNSTTGWESSPSPYSNNLTLASQKGSLSNMQTACAKEGVDKKRIYRTQVATNEEPFFRVTEIALATTTYTDDTADTSLGPDGPIIGDHDAPPDPSYLGAKFAGCFWLTDGSTGLFHSKPYEGSLVNLEYYSYARVDYFDQKITGLTVVPQWRQLVVFQPPGKGIYTISGKSDSTFTVDVMDEKQGTEFPQSVCTDGNNVFFWGLSGPTILTKSGQFIELPEINNYLKTIFAQDFTTAVYVWAVWHPGLQQFICGVGAPVGAVNWEDAITSEDAQWEDTITGQTITWEAVGGAGVQVRQVVFGVAPADLSNIICEIFSWPYCVDGNESGEVFSCAWVPPGRPGGLTLYQEAMWMGTIGAGVTLNSFRSDLGQDGNTPVTTTVITHRLDPDAIATPLSKSASSTSKRYRKIIFQDVIPELSGSTVQWCKSDPSKDPSVVWRDFSGTIDSDIRGFESGLSEFVHLKVVDATNTPKKEILNAFAIDYYTTNRRMGADT